MRHYRWSWLLCLVPGVWMNACSDDARSSPTGPDAATAPIPDRAAEPADAAPQQIELQFEGRVGTELFSCTRSYDGIGTSNAAVLPADFRFFVHDVVLVREITHEEVPLSLSTNAWQNPSVALVDFEDHQGSCTGGTTGTNSIVAGSVPPGRYDGVRFTVGVPQALNHVNMETAAPPLPASKLQWSWAGGFLHLSLEFRSTKLDDGGVVPAFYAHIGSTGCSGDPATGGMACARPNRPRIALTGFDAKTSKIVVDAKVLYSGSNVDENAADTIPGCMGAETDSDCAPMFSRLALDFASGTPTGESSPVFSVAPR